MAKRRVPLKNLSEESRVASRNLHGNAGQGPCVGCRLARMSAAVLGFRKI